MYIQKFPLTTFGIALGGHCSGLYHCIAVQTSNVWRPTLRTSASIVCDNQDVVKNTSIPESELSKKHNPINNHAIQEAAAAGALKVHMEDTQTNLSDLFTKVVPSDRPYELQCLILNNLYCPGFQSLASVPFARR